MSWHGGVPQLTAHQLLVADGSDQLFCLGQLLVFPCVHDALCVAVAVLQEHEVYVHVVAALCEGRIIWREDGVPLIRSAWGSQALE